ncbi:MAG: hypothetical protein Q9221_001821 [Calogaya cf. arnoldii]
MHNDQGPQPPMTTISLPNMESPRTTISATITPSLAPSPTPTPPPFTLPILHHRAKKDPTVTESITITIHERVTEKQTLFQTDTVYINETVFIHDTVTHTSTKPITIHPTAQKITFTETKIVGPTGARLCAAAQTDGIVPMPAVNGREGPKGPVIAGAVVGSLAGLALVMGAAWLGVRKWRNWKAKRNGHMNGVELQRRWEREQEMRVKEDDGGDV